VEVESLLFVESLWVKNPININCVYVYICYR